MRDIRQQYHRRSRRVTMGEPVKLRPSSPRDESFEEIATTRNVSREGFYFLTKRESYQEGMRLFVTIPYHSPTDLRNREYVGQVARVELLDDERGVAVQLLSTLTATPPTGLPGSSPP
jgi:PilZ domain